MKKEVLTPGKVLKNLIQKHQISVLQAAQDTDITPSGLNQVVNGKNRITVSVGLKLAKYFGLDQDYLINLQLQYDIIELKKDPDFAAVLKGIKAVKEPKKKPKETPVETRTVRRPKAEKAEAPKKPVKASAKRESKPAKDQGESSKETAKGARSSKAAKPEKPMKNIKMKSSVLKEQEVEEELEKPIKPPRKPRSAKKPEKSATVETPPEQPPQKPPKAILIKHRDDTPITEDVHVLSDFQIVSKTPSQDPEPETSRENSDDFKLKTGITDKSQEPSMDNSEDNEPDDTDGSYTGELEFGEDIEPDDLPEEKREE
jgi:addiction module HigA family antidote